MRTSKLETLARGLSFLRRDLGISYCLLLANRLQAAGEDFQVNAADRCFSSAVVQRHLALVVTRRYVYIRRRQSRHAVLSCSRTAVLKRANEAEICVADLAKFGPVAAEDE